MTSKAVDLLDKVCEILETDVLVSALEYEAHYTRLAQAVATFQTREHFHSWKQRHACYECGGSGRIELSASGDVFSTCDDCGGTGLRMDYP